MGFSIGETVGPYRIVEQLGQGGMATVFKAYHANLDRFVAIKVLHPSFKEDGNFFIRFKREAQIVARLEHPHIVPVYDFSEVGEPYIAMKFIEGETLKHRVKRQPLTLQETLRIMTAIGEALTYAHNQNVLHRDVKPSNVMLDKNEYPYLADFGLARMASSGESTMSQDVLIGTPHYISPEQAKGAKELGPATDIYSLGIMLYEIVVGRVPFSADTPYAIVHDHIYKPLPIPSQVNPTVPPQVELVLLKALSKEPSDRYASAVEMMNAFKEAIAVSNLSELSAASLRIEKFDDPSSQPIAASTEDGKLNAYIKSVLQTELASRAEPAIPMPGGTPLPVGSSAAQRRKAQSRRNFWILSGIVALIFICIASLAVIINALQNPVLADQPEAEDATATPAPSVDLKVVTEMSVQEAEDFVADEPNNPEAHLTLALAYFKAGRLEESQQRVDYAINSLNPSADLLAQAAGLMVEMGQEEQAIYLYFAAYHADPQNEVIRNEAGQYVYEQLSENTSIPLVELQSLNELYPDSPFTKSMLAQMMLARTRRDNFPEFRRTAVQNLLQDALAIDDSFAEAHLIYGNYYSMLGDDDQAQDSWRFARSFADTPEWVRREANRRMENFINP